jgi:hypothetical protein
MKDDLAQSEERSYHQEKPEGGSKTVQKDACATAKHTQHSQAFTPKPLNQITRRTLKNTYDTIHRPEKADLKRGDIEIRYEQKIERRQSGDIDVLQAME